MRWAKIAPWLIAWGLGSKLLADFLAANEQPAGQPYTPLLVGSAAAVAAMTLIAAYAVHSKR